MNKLLIQYTNNKFINNIQLSTIDFCDTLIVDTKSQLYKIFYEHQFTHILFIGSLLGAEEIQFIKEFGKQTNIYIYNDRTMSIPDNLPVKGILQHNRMSSSYKTINIPILVNNEIFYKPQTNYEKKSKIITFLDNIQSIPAELNEYLYPDTRINIPIVLLNNPNIIHPQNLGVVSEIDKANMLRDHKYYLALNEDYVPEAWACDSIVLTVNDLQSLTPTQFKNSKYFQSYSNFLKVLLSGKN